MRSLTFCTLTAWAACGLALTPRWAHAEIKSPVERTLIAVLDSRTSTSAAWQSTTRGSVQFYDPNVDFNNPIFSAFVGWDDLPVPPVDPGNFEDVEAITADPRRGDIYILGLDSPDSTPLGDARFAAYRADFSRMYNHWINNGGSATSVPVSAYRTYGEGPFAVTGDPLNDHANPTPLTGSVELLADNLARNQNDRSGTFNDFFAIEYVDENTLLVLDDFSGPSAAATTTLEQDYAIRALVRNPGTGTWSSNVLGYLGLDGPTNRSEPTQFAYVNRDGAQGVWIGEFDQGFISGMTSVQRGSDVAFFEITNWSGTAGNGYREFRIGDDPLDLPDGFALDEDPTVDTSNNKGELSQIWTRDNGDLVILEKSFDDASDRLQGNGRPTIEPGHHDPLDKFEPKLIVREVENYNYSGELGESGPPLGEVNNVIDFGGWETIFSDVASTGVDDDGTFTSGASTSLKLAGVTEDRWAAYDPITNLAYLFDNDGSTSPGGASDTEVYVVDLNTGVTSLAPNSLNGVHAWLEKDGFATFHFVRGDTDFSGDFTANDIDLALAAKAAYAANSANYDSLFDFTGDGAITQADLDALVGTTDTVDSSILGTAAGDTNLDGVVSAGDFARLMAAFGQSGGWSAGNSTGGATVGQADFDALAANYGFENGLGNGGFAAASVPEPTSASLALLGAGLALLGILRRRAAR